MNVEQAEFDPVAYLATKGLHGKKSGREVAYPCFADCGEDPSSRKRKLYINSDTGFWTCFVCGARGGTTLLLRHFGDEELPAPELGVDLRARTRILNEAAQRGAEYLLGNDEVLDYLLYERGLSGETIERHQLGWVGNRWSLTDGLGTRKELLATGLVHRDGDREGQDFFYDHLLIPYHSHGQVVQIRGRAMSGPSRYMTGPGESVRLFNSDALIGADEVIVTEGEFDAMVLSQLLASAPDERARRIGVVAVPGTNARPAGFESYLEGARRVYVGFDPDEPGRKAAVDVKEKLGSRARILELPDTLPKCDWSEFIVQRGAGWRDVLDLLGEAQGKRLYTVSDAHHSWATSIASTDVGLRTGYVGLDETITPGLLPGQVMVLLAKTGTGKTIWLCNVAYYMRDRHCLFVSLEMTREEVYERLRRIYLFHNPEASDRDVLEAFSRLLICDENRLGERELVALIDEYEQEVGVRPEAVYVDYLGYYAKGMPGGSPYEKTSNAVMQLKGEAKSSRVAVITPAQVNRLAKAGKPIDLDDARDSGVIEETADFALAIWKPDDLQVGEVQHQPTGKLRLSVLKSRHGGVGRTFTLQMDLLTLAIVDDGTPEAKRAANNNHLFWRGTTYEDLRAHQTTPVQLVTGA